MFSVHRRFVVPLCVLSGALWGGFALAATQAFQVPLVGTQQVPAVETTGMGMAELTYDPATRVVTWTITYGGLSGPVTMAHFHGPAAKGENEEDVHRHLGDGQIDLHRGRNPMLRGGCDPGRK